MFQDAFLCRFISVFVCVYGFICFWFFVCIFLWFKSFLFWLVCYFIFLFWLGFGFREFSLRGILDLQSYRVGRDFDKVEVVFFLLEEKLLLFEISFLFWFCEQWVRRFLVMLLVFKGLGLDQIWFQNLVLLFVC